MVRFLLEFHQPLVYILLAAALITALLQEWVDSGVILGVVLVNAMIGFAQESKGHRWLLAGVGMMAALQVAFTYVPAMNRAFSSEPIGITEWFLILGTGTLIYLAVETEKWLRRRWATQRHATPGGNG